MLYFILIMVYGYYYSYRLFSTDFFFVGEQQTPLSKILGSALTVKGIWQRIVYDQWIVGIDVENTSKR